jgi:hypothetical protein
MRYSPKPHTEYLTPTLDGPGNKFLFLPGYWNLAYLTLPGIEECPTPNWQPHPIEGAILEHMWQELRNALETGYPMEAVGVILKEGVELLRLCDSWEPDTYDTMMRRATEAEARLRAENMPVVTGNVIQVNFRRSA